MCYRYDCAFETQLELHFAVDLPAHTRSHLNTPNFKVSRKCSECMATAYQRNEWKKKQFKLRNKRLKHTRHEKEKCLLHCNICTQTNKKEDETTNAEHTNNHTYKEKEQWTTLKRTVMKCVYSVQKLMHHHDQRAITVIK